MFYVGVDVGTASVRAALVTREGFLKSTAEEPICIWEPQSDHYVQSSTEIWEKCCIVIQRVVTGVERSQVRGIGFDATCSLVVLDQCFQPVSVCHSGDKDKNVVMWMDHRAAEQAVRITNTGHQVLSRVGGVMSPEMQPPKLLWLKEINHMVKGHAAYTQLQELAKQQCPYAGENIYSYLNSHLTTMNDPTSPVDLLTSSLHVWPDFHGNRSPLADPTLKGMVVGLPCSQTLEDLALLYLATVQALALGTLHILETMKEVGHDIRTIFFCGGLSKNPLYVKVHANATGLPVVLPDQMEAVLVGAAVLGACASQDYRSIQEAMAKMAEVGKVVWPDDEVKCFYKRKYSVFLRLVDHQREYQALMNPR